MATSGTVTINIVGDATRLKSALGDAEGGLQRFSTKMQDVGTRMMSFGTKMTLGVTAPLALFGKLAFDAASDLTESLNKVDVIFQDSAAVIRKWSKDASTDLLISRQAALEAAATLGSVFKASGLGVPEAAKMSKVMVQLAADMGSLNNVPTEDMLVAIRAGLVGEAEPLRKFGVLLSEAAVTAKAMELGLADSNGELSEGAKVQARYALILEQTRDAQGDIERTADSAANKQKKLKAEVQDAAAQLGTSLVPIMLELAKVLTTIVDWFSQLSPKMQKIVVIAGLAAAAIGPLSVAIGGLVTIIGLLITPVGLIVVAIAAVVAAIVVMWLKWNTIWNFIKEHPAIGIVVGILAAPVAALFLIVGAVKYVYENWSTIWPQVQSVLQSVWSVLEPIFEALKVAALAVDEAVKWVADHAPGWWATIRTAVVDAWNEIEPILVFMRDRINEIVGATQFLADHAAEWFARMVDGANQLWDAINGPLLWLWDRLRDIVKLMKFIADFKAPDLGLPSGSNLGLPDVNPFGPNFGLPFVAEGGVVTKPTVLVAGEAGPEAIVPLDKMGAMGGISIGQINITTDDPNMAVDTLVRKLRTEAFLAGMN